MARRCLASPAVESALKSEAVFREVPFTTSVDGGYTAGRVDLVARVGDGIQIVDYKTDLVSAAQAAEHATEHFSAQAQSVRRGPAGFDRPGGRFLGFRLRPGGRSGQLGLGVLPVRRRVDGQLIELLLKLVLPHLCE